MQSVISKIIRLPGAPFQWLLMGLPLMLPLVGGCYECRWSAAGKIPTPADTIEGRWKGTWKSEASGHEGGLRCIITPAEPQHTLGAPPRYHADFHATFAWIFSFGYQMDLTVRASDGATQPSIVYFNGEADLGWLAGGKYTYDGKADPKNFFCNYRSKSDHGTFQMVRPGGR